MNDLLIELQLAGLGPVLNGLKQVNAQMKQLQRNQQQIGAVRPRAVGLIGGANAGSGGAGSLRTPPTFQKKLMTLISSTRIGTNGSVMPLIGNLVKLFGPAGVVAGFIVSGAVAISKALFDAAKKAAELGQQFTHLMFQTGATPGEAAKLSGLSNVLGIDAGSLARSLGDALAHNGVTAGFGGQMNVYDSGIFGDVDKATNLLKVLENVNKLSRENQIRFARTVPGMEEAISKMQMLGPDFLKRLKEDAARKQKIFDPEFLRDSALLQESLARLGGEFQNLLVTAIKPLLPGLIRIVDTMNTFTRALTDFLKTVYIGYEALMGVPMDKIKKDLEGWGTALDRNTEATRENTRVLNPGTYGGGERARGAMPSAWHGQNFSREGGWNGQVTKLGAFAL